MLTVWPVDGAVVSFPQHLLYAAARLLHHQFIHHRLKADTHHDGLLTGDGDPLQAVLAHQILEGQLQLDLAFGRAAGIGRAVGYGDLLPSRTERRSVMNVGLAGVASGIVF